MTAPINFNFTPSLYDVIQYVIERRLAEVHTCLPGKIVEYDKDQQKASVQIQLKKMYGDGAVVDWPVIPSVTVVHPRANDGSAFIHMPLKPGDDVMLVIAERSLDNWKTAGGVVNPRDTRKFNITDAYAIIGGAAFPDAFKPETDDSIEIVNGDSKIHVHDDGTYNVKGGNADDLVWVLDDLIQGLQRARTATLFGPQPLVDPLDPGWTIVRTRADAFTEGTDPYGGV